MSLRGRVKRDRIAPGLQRHRFTAGELIGDYLEIRGDLFTAHALFRFEENFLWHTGYENGFGLIKMIRKTDLGHLGPQPLLSR